MMLTMTVVGDVPAADCRFIFHQSTCKTFAMISAWPPPDETCEPGIRSRRAGALHRWPRRLARDIKTDVLVIGAGITGALIADALTSAGVEVAVVDKRGLAKGSTVASTALVQYEIDTPLITLTRKIGKEKAVRAWRRSRLAVEALAARLGELKRNRRGAPRFALSRRQRRSAERARARARGTACHRPAEPLPRPRCAARRFRIRGPRRWWATAIS